MESQLINFLSVCLWNLLCYQSCHQHKRCQDHIGRVCSPDMPPPHPLRGTGLLLTFNMCMVDRCSFLTKGGGGCILFFPESFYTTYKTTVEMTKLIFKWYLNLMSSGQNWMLWWCRKLLFWNVITINAFCAMLKVTYQLVLLNVDGLLNLIPSQFLVSSWVSWTVFLNRMSYSHDNFKDSQGGSFFLFSFLWYPGYSDRNAVTWERKLL